MELVHRAVFKAFHQFFRLYHERKVAEMFNCQNLWQLILKSTINLKDAKLFFAD